MADAWVLSMLARGAYACWNPGVFWRPALLEVLVVFADLQPDDGPDPTMTLVMKSLTRRPFPNSTQEFLGQAANFIDLRIR